MGKIKASDGVVTVTFSPDEILHRPVVNQDGTLSGIAGSVEDLIRRAGWHAVNKHKPDLAKKSFDYGMVEVVDGQFVISFVEAKSIKPDPGGP